MIDWSACAADFPKLERAVAAWTGDFVGSLGGTDLERNPNEKLRVKVPVVSNVTPRLSAFKNGAYHQG